MPACFTEQFIVFESLEGASGAGNFIFRKHKSCFRYKISLRPEAAVRLAGNDQSAGKGVASHNAF